MAVQTAAGWARSSEEPACINHERFAAAVREAAGAAEQRTVVVAEGYQLLRTPGVAEMLDAVLLLELALEDCVARRSAPEGLLNPKACDADYVRNIAWPAHERYMQECVEPLGARVQRLPSPDSGPAALAVAREVCLAAGIELPADLPQRVMLVAPARDVRAVAWLQSHPDVAAPDLVVVSPDADAVRTALAIYGGDTPVHFCLLSVDQLTLAAQFPSTQRWNILEALVADKALPEWLALRPERHIVLVAPPEFLSELPREPCKDKNIMIIDLMKDSK